MIWVILYSIISFVCFLFLTFVVGEVKEESVIWSFFWPVLLIITIIYWIFNKG